MNNKTLNTTEVSEKKNLKNSIKKPFSGRRKILSVIGIIVVLLITACYGIYHYEYSRLQRVEETAYTDESMQEKVELSRTDEEVLLQQKDMESRTEELKDGAVIAAEGEIFKDSNVYNILLIGSDERSAKFSDNSRGDTCMLLSLNKKTGEVHLVSFERGMGMEILEGPYEGQFDWLTHTFWYGGGELMVKEISEHFKVDVSNFVRINIRTLINLVDAIGGVDIELTEKEADHLNNPKGTYTAGYITGMHVEDEMQEVVPGVNHMNGATAMVYARTRAIDDDWHRIQRQRRVVVAAAKRLASLNTAEMISTLDAIIPMVQTNLTEMDIANLLTLAPYFIKADVKQMTIPVNGTYGGMHGMAGRSLFAVDFDINSKILKSELYGTPMPDMDDYEYQASEVYEGVGTTKFAYHRNDEFDTSSSEDNEKEDEKTDKDIITNAADKNADQNKKTQQTSSAKKNNTSSKNKSVSMTIDPQDIENMFSEDETVADQAAESVQKVFEAQYAQMIKNAKTDEEAKALSEQIVKQQEEALKEAVAKQAQENAEKKAAEEEEKLYNGMDYDTAVKAEEAFKKVQEASAQGTVPQLTQEEYNALVKAAEAAPAQ